MLETSPRVSTRFVPNGFASDRTGVGHARKSVWQRDHAAERPTRTASSAGSRARNPFRGSRRFLEGESPPRSDVLTALSFIYSLWKSVASSCSLRSKRSEDSGARVKKCPTACSGPSPPRSRQNAVLGSFTDHLTIKAVGGRPLGACGDFVFPSTPPPSHPPPPSPPRMAKQPGARAFTADFTAQ